MTSSDPDPLVAGQLPPILSIRPFAGPVSGEVRLPGSKSITNRAMLLAALSSEKVRLENALFSDDTAIMTEALRALGLDVRPEPESSSITVTGRGGQIPVRKATIDVGNAGTAARFLTALCALPPDGEFLLDGVEQMRRRPIGGLVEALRQAGADIETSTSGGFPLRIRSHGLTGNRIEVDASGSSQLLSALLMVAPMASSDLRIRMKGTKVRRHYVSMTVEMMKQFGLGPDRVDRDDGDHLIRTGPAYPGPGSTYRVESDASAASYFLALPAVVGGDLRINDLRLDGLQGDARFADIIRRLGCEVRPEEAGLRVVRPVPREGLRATGEDFFEISDTFLTLAALSPLLDGPTRITGIAHTRKQETDRVAAMATELRRLGQKVEETEDSLTIHPAPLREAEIETYHDHRIAMSFAILGCHDLHGDGRSWLRIANPATCAKTFPGFFRVLEDLRPK